MDILSTAVFLEQTYLTQTLSTQEHCKESDKGNIKYTILSDYVSC